VNRSTDQQLLGEFAENRSEEAFAELVRRHIDLVHSAAVRMVYDSHLAQDVTQGVFVALAENARPLIDHAMLSGWLHRTTRNLAANVVRSEVRRRAREEESAAMNNTSSDETDDGWNEIAPNLDAAIGDLGEADRDAVLLRYFERLSAGDMARRLGISEEAAQKRVGRAVVRLRGLLAKRGIGVGAGSVAALLSVHAVQAAPSGLIATVSAVAVAGTASASLTAVSTIVMTTLQKAAITLVVAAAVSTGIYQSKSASRLREETDALRLERSDMAAQIADFDRERHDQSNYVAALREDNDRVAMQLTQATRIMNAAPVSPPVVASAAGATGGSSKAAPIPEMFRKSFETGLKSAIQMRVLRNEAMVVRMQERLGLKPEQGEAIKLALKERVEAESDLTLRTMTGELTPEQADQQRKGAPNEEALITGQLDRQQKQGYAGFQEEEARLSAHEAADITTTGIQGDFGLSQEEADRVRFALTQLNVSRIGQPVAVGGNASVSGALATATEMNERSLTMELDALKGILSDDQLLRMREKRQTQLDQIKSAAEIFLPRTDAVPVP
jgi:RNA polymerase sigma factor (sigma-70 family)